MITQQLCNEQHVHAYRRWSILRPLGPHLRDRCLHHLQGLLEGQLQRPRLPLVLEEHQRLQQLVHLLCRTASVSGNVSVHEEQRDGPYLSSCPRW